MHSTFEKRHPPFPEKVPFFRHRFSLEMQLLQVLNNKVKTNFFLEIFGGMENC